MPTEPEDVDVEELLELNNCVTLVTTSDVDAVFVAFGADMDAPPLADDQDFELDEITVFEWGSGAIAIEYATAQGIRSEVLTRLSAEGRAASLCYTGDGFSYLCLAERGKVLLRLEPWPDVRVDDPQLAEHFRGLDFDEPRIRSAQTVLSRFTGLPASGPDVPASVRRRIAGTM